jgi:hypothetical protein
LFREEKTKNFHTPISIGSRPRNPMGSEGRAIEAPKLTMLMIIITVNPIYWPREILRGVTVLLVDALEKNVTKTNMSSILVMVNELHAIPPIF